MGVPGTKKQRKDGGKQEHRQIENIRVQQILGEILELVLKCQTSRELRKTLNSSAWKIKKAVLVEALELGDLNKANRLASEILNLTEVKKAAIQADVNVNENVQVLLAEIRDIPFEQLEQRAKKLRELRRLGDASDRRGDEASESREVLLVQDGAVQR